MKFYQNVDKDALVVVEDGKFFPLPLQGFLKDIENEGLKACQMTYRAIIGLGLALPLDKRFDDQEFTVEQRIASGDLTLLEL